ncbi:MAG: rhomboid family intramembrane serine protease [Ignavibacteriales bacterium]|nr:rhomboid family intramembrane serine protease [Ignavibacteriales bacterium]
MIPLRDSNPSRTFPFVNYTLIGLNVIVFLIEVSMGDGMEKLIFYFGLIPSSFVTDIQTFQIGVGTILPLISSMFLHGGWMHLIGNMLFLHIFGDNVEDRFGRFKYLVFYLIAGLAAAGTQLYMFPESEVPMIGASGAIAGVLGAYVFMFPRARIATLIPIFFFFQVVELPAFIFLGIWFVMQIFSGMFTLGIGADAGGVAWWAHIGGFLARAAFLPFLKRRSWR